MSDKTVQALASELAEAFVSDTRNDGKEFIKLRDGSPQWMTDVIHAVHGDKLPDDTVYSFVDKCATAISELDADASEEQINEAIYQLEPDVYTSKLTAWLHARADHHAYCDEASEEYGPIEGGLIALLQAGQKKQIEEVGFALIAELQRQSEEE